MDTLELKKLNSEIFHIAYSGGNKTKEQVIEDYLTREFSPLNASFVKAVSHLNIESLYRFLCLYTKEVEQQTIRDIVGKGKAGTLFETSEGSFQYACSKDGKHYFTKFDNNEAIELDLDTPCRAIF